MKLNRIATVVALATLLRAAGFTLSLAPSTWHIGPGGGLGGAASGQQA